MPDHPHRVWRLQGATNFRDLGGYVGEGGRVVRWRRLFRAEHLAGLTPQDHAAVQAVGLRRAFDFRGVQERAAKSYDVPGITQHALSIEPTVTQRMDALAAAGQSLTPAIVAELMRDLYRRLITEQSHRFAELFEHLLQDDSPLVFHCTAGKDRTGVAAALILRALGVPHEVVREDYLLTNVFYRHPPLPPTDTPPEVLAVLWSVQDNFLDAAWQVIDEQHGGLDSYLMNRLGVTPAARRALLERYTALSGAEGRPIGDVD